MGQTRPLVGSYLDAHRAFASNGAARDPVWLQAMRQRAIEAFDEAGFPSGRHEAWRFTNLDALTSRVFESTPAQLDDQVTPDTLTEHVLQDEWPRVVMVNGRHSAALSSPATDRGRVWIGSLQDALRSDRADIVEQHLGRYAKVEGEAFAALSTAFTHDGVLVHVSDRAQIDTPIHIVCVSTGQTGQTTHPRILVVAEPESRAAIVESHVHIGGSGYWTNTVAEGVIGDGAHVDWFRIQQDNTDAIHIGTTHARLGRDSRWLSCTVALGGRLARHNLSAELAGEGAHATLDGLYLLRGSQHTDHHTTIDHASPHCTSHELFNGILDEQSRAVFTGRIIVRRGAQRTDSKQSNNNVLLTEEARADSQPQLEIYADDVRCTHGATLGPIDERALFYLRSRGMSAERAKQMLTYGFAADVLREIQHAEIRDVLDSLIQREVSHIGRGGA